MALQRYARAAGGRRTSSSTRGVCARSTAFEHLLLKHPVHYHARNPAHVVAQELLSTTVNDMKC